MYNVVLAAVLLAGGESTAWHHSSCHGCSGYSGYQRSYSCYGCSGCLGYSGYYRGCHGCSGWYGHSACNGCYGWYGYSGSSGCSGCYGYSGCYGCSGCYGYSYYSSGCSGCFGCSGGGVVIATPAYSSCYGSWGCCGGVVTVPSTNVPVAPHVVMPAAGDPKATAAEIERLERMLKELRERAKKATKVQSLQQNVAPKSIIAKVTVNLPADARLWVDRVECPLTTGVRTFDTPALQPGKTYFYTVRIQLERDGRTLTDSQRVVVSAGQQVSVNFGVPTLATAQR